MHPCAFYNAYNIDSLDVSRNNLTRLPELCALVETICYFSAKYNKISAIWFSYFEDFVGLHELNLAMNRLGMRIEPDFSPLAPTLRLIRLSGRGIYLDRSQVTDIPVDALRSWSHIVGLGVRNNLINCLNDIRNTTRLTKIRIRASNNPWHCGSCLVSVKVVQVLYECLKLLWLDHPE